MKKILGFLLLFAMLFSLCACGEDDSDARSTRKDTKKSDETIMTSKSLKEEAASFSVGKTVGDVYTSDFIDLSYTLDSGWSFYNDEKIKELNNFVMDISGEEYIEAVKNATVFYDMFAADSENINNVNISMEKTDNAQLSALNIQENIKKLIPILKSSYENMGYTNINFEITELEVDGRTVDGFKVSAEIKGVKMYQAQFQFKCNGYLVSATTTTFFENTTADLLDNFVWTK